MLPNRGLCAIICFVFATLMLMSSANADPTWTHYVQKDYNLYGHLYNTDDGTATGQPKPYCAPTATMNSFIYLENKYPHIYDNLLTPDTDLSAREELRALMGGCEEGASDQEWWEGKVAYLEDKAPGKTVYKGMVDTPIDIAQWERGDVLVNAYPTIEFLFDNLFACEDVEIKIQWNAGIGYEEGAHALTLTSLEWNDLDGNGIWEPANNEPAKLDYLDPNNPTTTFERDLLFDPLSNRLTFNWANGGANLPRDVWIDAAFVESIPEPATLSLLGMGSMLLLRRRRIA